MSVVDQFSLRAMQTSHSVYQHFDLHGLKEVFFRSGGAIQGTFASLLM